MEDLQEKESLTVKVFVPCGNLYVTVVRDVVNNTVKRIFIHRNSKFLCPTSMLDALSRQSTFQAKRDIKQLIKDLKGNRCDKCADSEMKVKSKKHSGSLAGLSCQDGLSSVLKYLPAEYVSGNP